MVKPLLPDCQSEKSTLLFVCRYDIRLKFQKRAARASKGILAVFLWNQDLRKQASPTRNGRVGDFFWNKTWRVKWIEKDRCFGL